MRRALAERVKGAGDATHQRHAGNASRTEVGRGWTLEVTPEGRSSGCDPHGIPRLLYVIGSKRGRQGGRDRERERGRQREREGERERERLGSPQINHCFVNPVDSLIWSTVYSQETIPT